MTKLLFSILLLGYSLNMFAQNREDSVIAALHKDMWYAEYRNVIDINALDTIALHHGLREGGTYLYVFFQYYKRFSFYKRNVFVRNYKNDLRAGVITDVSWPYFEKWRFKKKNNHCYLTRKDKGKKIKISYILYPTYTDSGSINTVLLVKK